MEACLYRWLRRTETCGISKSKNMTQEYNVLNTETTIYNRRVTDSDFSSVINIAAV